jgi:hypothetical protein
MRSWRTNACVATVILVASGASAQEVVPISYRLPTSMLLIKATSTTQKVFQADGTLKEDRSLSGVTFSLFLAVDTASRTMTVSPKALAKTNTKITLSADGLLAGVNSTSEGQLGPIVRNIFGIALSAAGAGMGIPIANRDPAELLYELEHGESAAIRRSLRAAIKASVERTATAAAELSGAKDEATAKALMAEMDRLRRSTDILRKEEQNVALHYAAWRSRKQDKQDKVIEILTPVDDLPLDSTVKDAATSALTMKMLGAGDATGCDNKKTAVTLASRMTCDLGVILTRVEEDPPPTAEPPVSGPIVAYRLARPVRLRLYEAELGKPIRHIRDTIESVVGRRSALATLALPTTKWSKRTLEATFTSGALTSMSLESSSAVADATDALNKVSGDYLASLKQMNEIDAERRKAAGAVLEQKLNDLKKQKEIEESRIALDQALASEDAKGRLAAVEAEAKLLEAQRNALVGSALVGRIEQSSAEVQILKMQNEALKARIEELELRRKLGLEPEK